MTEKTSVVGPHPLLEEPTLIIEPEDVQQVPDDTLTVRGRGPTGDCVNSRTKIPSIHVWQAM